MIDNFAGKTAVLTGAGSGFGLECARIGARLGMNLVLVDVQQDALDAAAAEMRAAGIALHASPLLAIPLNLLPERQRFLPVRSVNCLFKMLLNDRIAVIAWIVIFHARSLITVVMEKLHRIQTSPAK